MPPKRPQAADMSDGSAKKVTGSRGAGAAERAGEPRPIARRPPRHTPAGKFAKGNGLGLGRPKGSKDTKPRIDSIKAVYDELIETRGGPKLMLDAVKAGLKDKKRALGYLELGATEMTAVKKRLAVTVGTESA